MARTDANVRLERLRWLAHILDSAFTVPIINYRIGLDAVIGLLPGVGDVLTVVPSAYVVLQAALLGVPGKTLVLMVYNIGLEALVGTIPIIGDIFDAVWKANMRNLYLLERQLDPDEFARGPSNTGLVAFVLAVLVLLAATITLAAVVLNNLAGLLP